MFIISRTNNTYSEVILHEYVKLKIYECIFANIANISHWLFLYIICHCVEQYTSNRYIIIYSEGILTRIASYSYQNISRNMLFTILFNTIIVCYLICYFTRIEMSWNRPFSGQHCLEPTRYWVIVLMRKLPYLDLCLCDKGNKYWDISTFRHLFIWICCRNYLIFIIWDRF